MPKIDIAKAPVRKGSLYPEPFGKPAAERVRQALGDAGGLNDFGVNILTLPPGAWSSQRHWHDKEDEFVYVLTGELTLVTDEGEEILKPGDCAAFPKNASSGHHLINKSGAPATCLEVGTRTADDSTTYPDIDLFFDGNLGWYTKKNGTPYPKP
ncbi:MAG TPA: cupin domain-containing protein [Rhizomicrobium sp.]|nr:cupin domain-containing protein [Rhizomicrobium sp.]